MGKHFAAKTRTFAIFALIGTLFLAPKARAQETVLANFSCTPGPCEPGSDLIFDAAGNLYGTTPFGGTANGGTVFEMSPQAGGGWTVTILHGFTGDSGDGLRPQNALIFDAAGNLYGTTAYGGTHNGGTVFELTPSSGGTWTEATLHNFGNGKGPDGSQPLSNLIFDASGNLYGTTSLGGANNLGSVFELINGGSSWTEKALHSFSGTADGSSPWAGLTRDAAGNLYGTTVAGGAYGGGTVFELIPQAGGHWQGKAIYSFGKVNAQGWSTYQAYAGLTLDEAGNLYGTTYYGGPNGGGMVYELSPVVGRAWEFFPLHAFGSRNGGENPLSPLLFDNAGNLYGTAVNGGSSSNSGTVYELSPVSGGTWVETVLLAFDSTDGAHPTGGLIFDAAGNLYGTTSAGGTGVFGTVFEIAH